MDRGTSITGQRALQVSGRSVARTVILGSRVARWAFDEGNGTTTIDDWGTNNGQINGATYSLDSAVGSYSLSFDGSSDYVEVPDSTNFDITSEITLSIWVKTGDPNQGDNRLIDKSTNGTSEAFLLDLHNGCRLVIDAGEVESNSTVPKDSWTLVTATYDSSKRVARIYYDDTVEIEIELSGPITVNNNPIHIGTSPTVDSRYFVGDLDDARIYNKALTTTEVYNLYNTGSIIG